MEVPRMLKKIKNSDYVVNRHNFKTYKSQDLFGQLQINMNL